MMRATSQFPRLMFIAALCLPCILHPVFGAPASLQTRLAKIDAAVEDAIARKQLPGAVVLVLHRREVVFRKAYGLRSQEPIASAMTADTLFDLASLTKPIATATSLMILMERGKLKVTDPVAHHLPAFAQNGKESITVEQLLLHTSGLIADNPEADYKEGRGKALERIYQLAPLTPPGKRFRYSDVNYIVLGEVVAKLAKMRLDQFAEQNVFASLGMKETAYRPTGRPLARAAPTEKRNGHWMVGEVHDPCAFLLGGVAGHAGLFSTADDLAIYAQMILGGGAYKGMRILSEETVRAMTAPRSVPGGLRAYGWDVQTAFSSNRGDLFPQGKSFGHTGFTGTSIWIDPTSQTAVIFLSNRVHPNGKGDVKRLRGQVATLAAAAVLDATPHPAANPSTHHALTGIDVLVKESFGRLKGRRVGLVTNHTGVDRDGRSTIDLLYKATGVTLVALFSPEHGIRGAVDAQVSDSHDDKTGLPIYSLYGARRKPSAETLKGIDTLVFDIQDAGCRFYTYISTLGLVMEAAAESRSWTSVPLRVLVLDRPNPIGGLAVEGPMLDAGRESFVGYHRMPVRYGMTIGELARLYNGERKLGVDLDVVALEGWRRGDFYDRTGLSWVNPSPNLRSLTATVVFPGIGFLETTNVSVGRGTDRPFEWVGAPWIDGRQLAASLEEEGLDGVRFLPAQLTPVSSVHKGKRCGGVQIIVDNWARFRPLPTGLALARCLHRLYPDVWQMDRLMTLLGNRSTVDGLKRGQTWQELQKSWDEDLAHFREVRKRYLIYPE